MLLLIVPQLFQQFCPWEVHPHNSDCYCVLHTSIYLTCYCVLTNGKCSIYSACDKNQEGRHQQSHRWETDMETADDQLPKELLSSADRTSSSNTLRLLFISLSLVSLLNEVMLVDQQRRPCLLPLIEYSSSSFGDTAVVDLALCECKCGFALWYTLCTVYTKAPTLSLTITLSLTYSCLSQGPEGTHTVLYCV